MFARLLHLSIAQHGFGRGRSTKTAKETLIDEAVTELNQRRLLLAVVSLDIKQACDSVDRNLLLYHLNTPQTLRSVINTVRSAEGSSHLHSWPSLASDASYYVVTRAISIHAIGVVVRKTVYVA